MKFIVEPLEDKPQARPPMTTMCALCSEDPRFCGDLL